MTEKVPIHGLLTGVPGFDAVLGGGLPELSFTLITGVPGSGKTTLALQLMFSMTSPGRSGLFFTVLGEPPVKMLRYQQQFKFFDIAKVNESVEFINLGQEARDGGFDAVLKRIVHEVETKSPAIVAVDSFGSIMRSPERKGRRLEMEQFVQELAIRLTSWAATTFLVSEFKAANHDHPVFTVADGIVSLSQSIKRNSMVRKMQIMKMRGRAPVPGLHTIRITDQGLEVFPRLIYSAYERPPGSSQRLSIGVPGLDEMLGGGIPSGYSILVAGPSGSGKTILASQFIREGVRRGEPGVIVLFEKQPSAFAPECRHELVKIVNTRPLDLSMDETLYELSNSIRQVKAQRVVIDSLSGFELALAPTFREDFRESLYRMITALTGMGVTVMLTAELEDRYTDLRFSPHGTAFLTDAIILQRYAEIDGKLRRLMAAVKVRGCAHSKELHLFEITSGGIVVGESVHDCEGLLTGAPHMPAIGRRRPQSDGRLEPSA